MTLELYLIIAAIFMVLNLIVGSITAASEANEQDDMFNAMILVVAAIAVALLWPLVVFTIPAYIAIRAIRKFK